MKLFFNHNDEDDDAYHGFGSDGDSGDDGD